jgi:hypothetical protein
MGIALIAGSINIIILPVIVNYGFGQSLYGATGLAGIVFDYHITAVTVNILLQFNPVYWVKKIGLSVSCIRNYIIKSVYIKKEDEDVGINPL